MTTKYIIASLLIFSTLGMNTQKERRIKQTSFAAGEHIEYRVHYGIINAAEATVDVEQKIHSVSGKPCYKVTAFARTTGVTDWVSKVRDTWISYIDTTAILPLMFYMKKQEGNYKTEDKIIFDHTNNLAKSYELDDDHERKTYKVPDNIQDIVSGYYFLRTIDFDKVKVGDFVLIKAFFEGEVYDMRMRYKGKEVIKTKFGKMNTYKICPTLPKNNFFENEEAVVIWASDDENKIPLKIQIELKIGSIAMDIKKYSGVRHPLKFK